MKKIILASTAILFAFAVNAQDNKMESKPEAKSATQAQPRHHDHIMMKGGKMWIMKDGQTMAMDKEMDMPNGNKVMADGSVMMKDGTKMMMKDGDRMNMNGDLMKAPVRRMEENKADTPEKK